VLVSLLIAFFYNKSFPLKIL